MHTGDEVYFNERKEIFVVDRIKELIKVRGFQVAPAELEGLLLGHPAVADVCVVGVPDEFSGELPLAFVAPSTDAAARIRADPKEGPGRVRAEIMKVRGLVRCFSAQLLVVKLTNDVMRRAARRGAQGRVQAPVRRRVRRRGAEEPERKAPSATASRTAQAAACGGQGVSLRVKLRQPRCCVR